MLQQTWSPEEIVGSELVGVLSFKTIYSWIHRVFYTLEQKQYDIYISIYYVISFLRHSLTLNLLC